MLITKAMASKIANEQYENIYSFCCSRLRNTDDAGDITQEVFLMFQEKCGELDDTKIRSWLFSVADLKIKEEYRRRKKQNKLISYEEALSYDSTDGEKIDELICELSDFCTVDESEIEAAKLKVFGMLTPDEQRLFTMVYQNHLKYSDISEEMNTSERSIAVKVFRLKLKIKKYAELAFIVFLFLAIKLKI